MSHPAIGLVPFRVHCLHPRAVGPFQTDAMILDMSAHELLPRRMTVVMTDDTHLEQSPCGLVIVKTLPLPDSITVLSCTLTANMSWPE